MRRKLYSSLNMLQIETLVACRWMINILALYFFFSFNTVATTLVFHCPVDFSVGNFCRPFGCFLVYVCVFCCCYSLEALRSTGWAEQLGRPVESNGNLIVHSESNCAFWKLVVLIKNVNTVNNPTLLAGWGSEHVISCRWPCWPTSLARGLWQILTD